MYIIIPDSIAINNHALEHQERSRRKTGPPKWPAKPASRSPKPFKNRSKNAGERLKRHRKGHIVTGQIEDLLRRVDALPNQDSRPEDEILGYSEGGIPRQKERIFGLPTRNWFRHCRRSAGGRACLTDECVRPCVCVYSSSSLTSPRSAFAFSIILSCSCCGTVS